jgi:hypothetical protein
MSRFIVDLSNLSLSAPRQIDFTAGGRQWRLLDRSVHLTAEQRARRDTDALLTGELSTAAMPGEGFQQIEPMAGIICRLLTLARCRDVKDCVYHQVDAAGVRIDGPQSRAMHLHPFSSGGPDVINHWASNHDIRNLLENGFLVFAARPEWWHRTIDFFFQSRTQPYIDVQAVLLNILMDRLAAELPANRAGGEIVADLEKHLGKGSRMKKDLTAIMQIYWPGWTSEHTQLQFSNTLASHNARPSFAKGIRRLCRTWNVEAPDQNLLNLRHKLMHEGELVAQNAQLTPYVTELDSTILLLLLRKLNYSGQQVFVRKYGIHEMAMPAAAVLVPGKAKRSHALPITFICNYHAAA